MWTFLIENKVLDDYPKFSNDLKSKLDDVKNFFSEEKNEKIFSFIRNKFGFHYEYLDDVDELIDNALSNLDQYEAWLSSDSGNEIFASSNDVIFEVILSEMKKLGFVGDEKQLMSTLYGLTIKSARLFQEFSAFYITEAFSVKWEPHEEIEINVPAISEIILPLIVARQHI